MRPITWNDDPSHFAPPSRRTFLHVGAVGGLGLTLDQFFRLQAARGRRSRARKAKAKSVIHIFLPGGMAHQEIVRPEAARPDRVPRRDGHRSRPSSTACYFNECLKKTAQVADKITVCRSMTHGEAAHERGTHNMFTGYRPSPALQYPSMGSVVSHEFGVAEQPAALRLHPEHADDLRRQRLPVERVRPVQPRAATRPTRGFTVQDLTLPGGVDDEALHHRARTCSTRSTTTSPRRRSRTTSTAMDTFYQRAYSLISQREGPRGVQHQRRGRQAPRRIRPQRRRPADAAWPAGWSRRACGSCR